MTTNTKTEVISNSRGSVFVDSISVSNSTNELFISNLCYISWFL